MAFEEEYEELLDQLHKYGVVDQWNEPTEEEVARMRECLDCAIRDAADDKLLVIGEIVAMAVILIGVTIYTVFG